MDISRLDLYIDSKEVSDAYATIMSDKDRDRLLAVVCRCAQGACINTRQLAYWSKMSFVTNLKYIHEAMGQTQSTASEALAVSMTEKRAELIQVLTDMKKARDRDEIYEEKVDRLERMVERITVVLTGAVQDVEAAAQLMKAQASTQAMLDVAQAQEQEEVKGQWMQGAGDSRSRQPEQRNIRVFQASDDEDTDVAGPSGSVVGTQGAPVVGGTPLSSGAGGVVWGTSGIAPVGTVGQDRRSNKDMGVKGRLVAQFVASDSDDRDVWSGLWDGGDSSGGDIEMKMGGQGDRSKML